MWKLLLDMMVSRFRISVGIEDCLLRLVVTSKAGGSWSVCGLEIAKIVGMLDQGGFGRNLSGRT